MSDKRAFSCSAKRLYDIVQIRSFEDSVQHVSFATPMQLVAGRAMLSLSQEDLASAAGISQSTLRDLEAGRRPADGDAARAVFRELENCGLTFIPSDATGGPGVRLATHLPTLLRRPTVVTKWEGVPLEVEFQGRSRTAFASREALEDAERLAGPASDAELLEAVWKHRGRILRAVWRLIVEETSLDKQGRVYIRTADLEDDQQLHPSNGRVIDLLSRNTPVALDPLPRRIWQGVDQAPQDCVWWVHHVDREKGLVVIENDVTGHRVHLYHPAHLRDVVPTTTAGDRAKYTLALGVQITFEDGQVRLERPQAPSGRHDRSLADRR